MMNNLFSMFDPSSSYMSSSWLIMAIPMIMMNPKNFKTNYKINSMFMLTMKNFKKEMNDLMKNNMKKMSSNMMKNMFFIALTINLMALVPFNFTPTAHPSVSFSVSCTLWLSIMMYGFYNSFKSMMTHMTPLGTPNELMNFMVLIEMVSNMIRPITLCVRLSANMVAGHLLMSLLSNFSIMSNNNLISSSVPMIMLIFLEMAVSIVQAYVLTTLTTLYYNESFQ